MTKVTLYDVANAVQMSPSTVSRILRGGKGHVYPESTQQRVKAAAEQLGYQANTAARLLSQRAPTLIGMAVHFTEHPYLNRFLVAVHQELLKHNYDPVFLDSQHLSSNSSIQPFPPPHMLAGLISLGIDLQNDWPKHYAELRRHIPIVAVQPISAAASKWVDTIQVDFKSAYLQVCQHLTHLGHRHIAYLGVFDDPNPSDKAKTHGWAAAARYYGLPFDYRIPWVVKKPYISMESLDSDPKDDFMYQPESRETMIKVVSHLNAFPHRITALVCASDEVAIALQSYLQSQGIQLPRDLSVVGYDGISMGEYVYPSLTTIEPDYNKMAQIAVERLSQLILDTPDISQVKRKQLVAPRLVIRNSTATPS